MPRIGVFHVSAGTGHTSAARALAAALEQQPGVEVHCVDVFDHVNELAKKTISSAYNEISTRLQPLYTMVHSGLYIDDTAKALRANKAMTTAGRPFLMRFIRYVEQLAPDAIVCTMQWPLHVLEEYACGRGIPIYAVITDFSVQSTWLMEHTATYFVAGELNREVLRNRGVPDSKIQITGIPVKLEIAESKDRLELRRRHELPLDEHVVTVFGGGVVVERIHQLVSGTLELARPGVVVVVAGRNTELVNALADLKDGPKMKLRNLGFIPYVDDLVAASDLVVTKPGGLITSEVLARGTPMIVIDPVPGQEEWNADVVAASGAGVQVRVPELVPLAIDALFSRPERLTVMREQAAALGKPRAAYTIAERLLLDLG